MITGLLILIITMLDNLVFSWWLDPFLSSLQYLTIFVDGMDNWVYVVLTACRYLTFFVPVSHLIILITTICVITIVKTIFAIYNQAAQIIP